MERCIVFHLQPSTKSETEKRFPRSMARWRDDRPSLRARRSLIGRQARRQRFQSFAGGQHEKRCPKKTTTWIHLRGRIWRFKCDKVRRTSCEPFEWGLICDDYMSTISGKFMYSLLLYWCCDGIVALAEIYKATRPPLSGIPEGITTIRASPTSFAVTWSDGAKTSNVLRYLVAYRPVNDRYDIIQEADGDKRLIILDNLKPGTRYRVHVSAVTHQGRTNHSDVVLFDTDNPRNESERGILVGTMSVRPEEIGIVVVVLALWVFVIVLFFNKWGKIRMLEPYQPQYKHPRTPSCSHPHPGRLSMQLASFTSVERERLLYSGPPHVHLAARPRQNSVFVGNPYARYNLSQVTPSRKVKSAEDINSMVQFKTSNPRMQTTNV